MSKETRLEITKTVPREKAFYFFTSIGNYTGKSASSLTEFMEKISEVDVKSLEFHFYRKDFEKWFAEVLQDEVLAGELRKLHTLNLTGEPLRSHLYEIVATRLKQLTTSEITA
jgi:hypothetical protein